MFILTDGKNYVMENPMKMGEYLSTTSPLQARKFTFKQARSLLNRKGKRYSWVKNFKMVDDKTGEQSHNSKEYKGNAGAFIGENDIEFDEEILNEITDAVQSILNVKSFDLEQLGTYASVLNSVISKYDSAESDIKHALQKYREDNDDKRPPASKIAKVAYLLEDIRYKRKRVKQCRNYVQVMQDSITERINIHDIKKNLMSVKDSEYKGRTEYYQMALDYLS